MRNKTKKKRLLRFAIYHNNYKGYYVNDMNQFSILHQDKRKAKVYKHKSSAKRAKERLEEIFGVKNDYTGMQNYSIVKI